MTWDVALGLDLPMNAAVRPGHVYHCVRCHEQSTAEQRTQAETSKHDNMT